MSKLDDFKNNQRLKQYFRDNLEMDDEEFERRVQLYLEVFPFIAVDFRLKGDCNAIHQSAQIKTQSIGTSYESKIKNTKEIDLSYNQTSEEYRKQLEILREASVSTEITINVDGL